MQIVFYTSPDERRQSIVKSFAAGVLKHGRSVVLRPLGSGLTSGRHIAVIIGNKMRAALDPLLPLCCPVVCLDKAYAILSDEGVLTRDKTYSRITVNGSHPVSVLGSLGMPSDRRLRFNWRPRPWRSEGEIVVFAGAARSYYDRIGVVDVRAHTRVIIERIRQHTLRPIVFRVKPNMRKGLGEIDFGDLSNVFNATHAMVALPDLLEVCHSLVVEESSVSIEALLYGVPCVILGPSPTLPISSTQVDHVDSPHLATDAVKERLLNDLAYFQYNQVEYEDGTAWDFIKTQIEGASSPCVG